MIGTSVQSILISIAAKHSKGFFGALLKPRARRGEQMGGEGGKKEEIKGDERKGEERRGNEERNSAMNQHGENNLPAANAFSQQVFRTCCCTMRAAAMSDYISAHLKVAFILLGVYN